MQKIFAIRDNEWSNRIGEQIGKEMQGNKLADRPWHITELRDIQLCVLSTAKLCFKTIFTVKLAMHFFFYCELANEFAHI